MSPTPTDRHLAEEAYLQALDDLAAGDPEAAIAGFDTSIEADPGFLDARHGLVRALQDAGQYDRAIAAAVELIALDPDEVLAHTSLSILYQRKGMVPEAEAEALKAKLLGWKLELRASQTVLPSNEPG
jgi:tetratricopeptide (TPR) repeat protein